MKTDSRPTRSPLRLLLAAVLAAPCTPTGALADLTAIGHEFRPTSAQVQIHDSCTAADGSFAEVARCCATDPSGACRGYCDSNYRVFAQWRDAEGRLLAGPFELSTEPTWDKATYTCNESGTMLVVLGGRALAVDRSGIHGPRSSFCDGSCSDLVIAAINGGFFAAWSDWGHGVVGRYFSVDADLGNFVQITGWDSLAYPQSVGLAADEDGSLLVTWKTSDPPGRVRKVLASLVGGGDVVSPAVVLSEFAHVDYGDTVVRSEGPGLFRVAWHNPYSQGGWVARRVGDDDVLPTTTTTTTTLPPEAPLFVGVETLAKPWAPESYDPPPVALVGNSTGRWMSAWSDLVSATTNGRATNTTVLFSSVDDGRRWSPARLPALRYSTAAALATDGRGVWILAAPQDSSSAIVFRRSSDGGASWTDESFLALGEATKKSSAADEISLATGKNGVWVAAWVERRWSRGDDESQNLSCRVLVSVSTNSGRSWGPRQTLGVSKCNQARRGLKVATDRRGDWTVAWTVVESGSRIDGASSFDNALTWSQVRPLIGDLKEWVSNLDLAIDNDGKAVLAFTAWAYPAEGPGTSRVFVSRRPGPAANWSSPFGVAPWHSTEGGADDSPSIATADNGQWGIAWRTHTDMTGNGLDGDIALSFSSDSGATWSVPRPVDPDAKGDSRQDMSPRLAHGGADTWGVLWRTVEEPTDPTRRDLNSTIRFARIGASCGDGRRDVGEECDDANRTDGDGCDRNCLATACGNKITTSGEECDDGNDDNTDACTSTCRLAVCGDGFTAAGIETCDDGNDNPTDSCPVNCSFARCGDGYRWTGIEACDDGNGSNNDSCLRDCRPAVCGDGYLKLATEECDDANNLSGDGCSAKCWLETGCRETAALRATASDALLVLKKAVGRRVRCPRARCDMDRNGRVTAIDALAMLRAAVGLSLGCTADTSVRMRLESAVPLGALQFSVSFADTPGSVVVVDGEPDCTWLLTDNVLNAFHVDPVRSTIMVGLISWQGFHGPTDLFTCRFDYGSGPSANAFAVTIVDATDLNGTLIDPPPRVTATRSEFEAE